MAEEKIQLTFSGKYNASNAFKQANADIKDYQKAHKDMANAAKASLGEIAGVFDGELNSAMRNSISLLGEMARGGIWGVMGAVAAQTLTAIIGYVKRLHEEAEKHKQLMADMRSGMVKLMEAQVAAMEALKQDNLDRLAEKANAAVEAVDKLSASFRNLGGAEDAAFAAGGNLKIAQIDARFSKELNEACDQLRPLVQSERDLAVAIQREKTAREQQTMAVDRAKVALGEADRKIQLQKKAIEAETAAGHSTAAAYEKLSALQTERSAAVQRLAAAETAAKASVLQHKTAVERATAAVARAQKSWDEAVEANERELGEADVLAELKRQQAELLRRQDAEKTKVKILVEHNDRQTESAKKELDAARKFKDNIEKGILADNKTHEWMPHNFKRNSDGTLANMKDVSRASRAYEREQAKLAARRKRQNADIDKGMAELEKKGRGHWNDWDKKRYEDLQAQRKYLNGEDDASQNLEKLAEERKKILEESERHLKEIEESIKNLGLK